MSVDNLTPFRKDDGRARAAAQRSAEVRRAKRDSGRRDALSVANHLATLRATHERSTLGETCAAAAIDLVGRVASGEIKVRNGDEAASLLRALVDIARLEAGQSTSNAAVIHASAGAVERVRALQREASEIGASSSAQAADDAASVIDVGPVDEQG